MVGTSLRHYKKRLLLLKLLKKDEPQIVKIVLENHGTTLTTTLWLASKPSILNSKQRDCRKIHNWAHRDHPDKSNQVSFLLLDPDSELERSSTCF